MAKWLALLLQVWEVLGLNFGLETTLLSLLVGFLSPYRQMRG
jgi:hypothetical protein